MTDRVWIETPPSPWSQVSRSRKVVAALVCLSALGLADWWRGICWEALPLAFLVLSPVLALFRLPARLYIRALATVTLVGSLVLIGWSAVLFHTPNVFAQRTPEISWCGYRYVSFSPPSYIVQPAGSAQLHQVGVTPSGEAMFGSGCGTLWVQIGPRAYMKYGPMP